MDSLALPTPEEEWRWVGRSFSASASEVGEALAALAKDLGRPLEALEPDDVIDSAQVNPGGPLHRLFQWDVIAASRAYWREQARGVLRSIRRVDMNLDVVLRSTRRAFISIPSCRVRGQSSYIPVEVALANDSIRDELVGEAFRALRRWCERFCIVPELEPLVAAVEKSIEKLSAWQEPAP